MNNARSAAVGGLLLSSIAYRLQAIRDRLERFLWRTRKFGILCIIMVVTGFAVVFTKEYPALQFCVMLFFVAVQAAIILLCFCIGDRPTEQARIRVLSSETAVRCQRTNTGDFVIHL